mmetsp:Transcript_28421/g.45715  ORF Transcript_28421/g.45715 Transcript_28421/m.45715 type:complete len:104 (+) Transcript_28421:446-757(+)
MNVAAKWEPEIRRHRPGVPIILVGLKSDLRKSQVHKKDYEDGRPSIVSCEQGEEMAKNIGATKYMECSALTRDGLEDVFETACCTAMRPREKPSGKNPKCVLL